MCKPCPPIAFCGQNVNRLPFKLQGEATSSVDADESAQGVLRGLEAYARFGADSVILVAQSPENDFKLTVRRSDVAVHAKPPNNVLATGRIADLLLLVQIDGLFAHHQGQTAARHKIRHLFAELKQFVIRERFAQPFGNFIGLWQHFARCAVK